MTDNQKQNPVLADHIELNLSNYGQDEVEHLNSWALGAYDEIERLTGNLREAEARSVQNFVRWANHNGYADDWDVDVTRGYTLAIVDAWNYNGEGARKWQLDVNYHQSHTPAPWRMGKSGAVVADHPVPEKDGANYTECYGGYAIAESVVPRNARRIIACVNACEGIDIEVLEKSSENCAIVPLPLLQELISLTETAKVSRHGNNNDYSKRIYERCISALAQANVLISGKKAA